MPSVHGHTHRHIMSLALTPKQFVDPAGQWIRHGRLAGSWDPGYSCILISDLTLVQSRAKVLQYSRANRCNTYRPQVAPILDVRESGRRYVVRCARPLLPSLRVSREFVHGVWYEFNSMNQYSFLIARPVCLKTSLASRPDKAGTQLR
jgi:hypothetical protein